MSKIQGILSREYKGISYYMDFEYKDGVCTLLDVTGKTLFSANAVPDDIITSELEDLQAFLSKPQTKDSGNAYGIEFTYLE